MLDNNEWCINNVEKGIAKRKSRGHMNLVLHSGCGFPLKIILIYETFARK